MGVEAGFLGAVHVFLHAETGERDGGRLPGFSYFPDQVDAGAIGQTKIAQEEIEFPGLERFQPGRLHGRANGVASRRGPDYRDGLRSGRQRSLLAHMPKTKPRKRLRPRGFFGRWKWVLIPVLVLLLIPAMQVAAV